MSDGDLALAILTKIANDNFACMMVEDEVGAVIDTGWIDVTDDERDLLRRLMSAGVY